MAEAKPKLLIVEDDLDIADMLCAYFRVQGYEVVAANFGEDGVKAGQNEHPTLIILDIRLPDFDGYEVARRLRSNRRTENIPIIFLTDKRKRNDRLTGLGLGADDYITKPFDLQELRLRVRNSLRRASQDTLTNPVTTLPEGTLVDERLAECLGKGGWAMLLVALENLDSFREAYGFIASDDVLRAVSLMIQNVMLKAGAPGDFLGHLGPTDFVLLTSPEKVAPLKERIRAQLEQSLEYFYPIKDREHLAPGGKGLAVAFGVLLPGEGSFAACEQLRAALLAKKA
jgi:PleD family two-component response regulator